MSPSRDDVLKEFEDAEDAALQELLQRLSQAEDELRVRSGKATELLSRRFSDVRARLDQAARAHGDKVEAFRKELTDGPPDEDAYRARLVMLDMEYASRLRLAEEGLGLITDWAAEREAENLSWSKRFMEGLRTALETRVRPSRVGPRYRLEEDRRVIEEQRSEIEALKTAPKAPDLSERVAELEAALSRSEESCRTLADRASMRGESEQNALERVRSLETELSRLRERAERSESVLAAAEGNKKKAAAAEEERERAQEALAVSESRREEAEKRAAEAEQRAAQAEKLAGEARGPAEGSPPAPVPVPSVDHAQALSALREERDDWEERCRNAREAAARQLQEAREEIIRGTAGELESLRSRLRHAQLELETEQKRRAAIEARAAEAELSGADAEELEEMKRHLSRAHAEVQSWRSKTIRFEKERDAARGEAGRAVAEIESLTQQRDGLRERLYELQDSLERMPRLEKALKGLLSERAELVERLGREGRLAGEPVSAEESDAALKGLRGELDRAWAEAHETREKLAKALKDLESAREVGKAMQKRIMAADVHKDKAHEASRTNWMRERTDLQEELSQKSRELTMVKNQLEAQENNWRDIMVKQDSDRLKEIFQLKAELEKLRKKGG